MANEVHVESEVSTPVEVAVKIEHKKRPATNGRKNNAKRSKLDPLLNVGDRNPVAILNELRVGLKYDVVQQSGPPHAPQFTVSVDVDGHKYNGTGASKKVARCKAAELALKSFIQLPDSCKVATPNSHSANMDFTVDAFEARSGSNSTSPDTPKKDTTKNACMLLNELYPSVKYTCTENDDIYARFTFTVEVKGEIFTGTGSNKKMAKNAAATCALAKLLSIPSGGSSPYQHSDNQELADRIGRMVNEKFVQIMADDPVHAKRKVLAGIVMQLPDDVLQVISLATGTKCVSGEHISIQGSVLNDMHAEIVARRALVSFLYQQLHLHTLDEGKHSIFEFRPEGTGYKLRNGIEFHLYINSAPCGDARIFSPHDNICADGTDRHPNRSSRGQLRTKIESGEGTVPVKGDVLQTWDGVLQGERLLTMSCSDKVSRWNVLGLQGSLLSYFIEPIYLSSIILGSLFHKAHLYRALYGRIESTLQGLPPPFRLNRPKMGLVTSTETRHAGKAPMFSVNWMGHLNDDGPEVINTNTGRPETGKSSRLCKQAMLQKFNVLREKLSTTVPLHPEHKFYSDIKDSMLAYKVAKEQLYDAYNKAGLGKWVKKPIEQDQFEL